MDFELLRETGTLFSVYVTRYYGILERQEIPYGCAQLLKCAVDMGERLYVLEVLEREEDFEDERIKILCLLQQALFWMNYLHEMSCMDESTYLALTDQTKLIKEILQNNQEENENEG